MLISKLNLYCSFFNQENIHFGRGLAHTILNPRLKVCSTFIKSWFVHYLFNKARMCLKEYNLIFAIFDYKVSMQNTSSWTIYFTSTFCWGSNSTNCPHPRTLCTGSFVAKNILFTGWPASHQLAYQQNCHHKSRRLRFRARHVHKLVWAHKENKQNWT